MNSNSNLKQKARHQDIQHVTLSNMNDKQNKHNATAKPQTALVINVAATTVAVANHKLNDVQRCDTTSGTNTSAFLSLSFFTVSLMNCLRS